MKAAELMTRSPNCCVPSLSARMAAGLLARFHVGFLPVVDDYTHRLLLGVITDRDLCVRVLAAHGNPDEVAVWDCMTRDAVSCTADTDAEQILELMVKHGVRRVPVVDTEGTLLGIVSIDDLARQDALPATRISDALTKLTTMRPGTRLMATGV